MWKSMSTVRCSRTASVTGTEFARPLAVPDSAGGARRSLCAFDEGLISEALLLPGVATHMIAVPLPESGLILLQKLDSRHPFSALPRIEPRHDQPRWSTMFAREGHAIMVQGYQRVLSKEVR